MAITTNRWMPYAGYLHQVDLDNEALSVIRNNQSTTIVRKTMDNQFAVMALRGSMAKIVKVLPTLDRARAYNFAINRDQ